MAGINPISGQFGMPDHQFKSAMISTSDKAAVGTGTAKKHTEHLDKDSEHIGEDSVMLSHQSGTDATDESAKTMDDAEKKARQFNKDGKNLERQRS